MLLYLLAAASLFMLWRDWKSGRIYYLPRYGGLKYEDPDPFWERERTPILYWGIWITVGSCGAVSALLELLSSLGLTGRINEDFRVIIFLLGIGIQSFYFLGGLGGRFVSWVKNYGSVDKQW